MTDEVLTTTDGVDLALRRYGSGPAVVLVHGSSGGLDTWDDIAPRLADEFELWAYARAGYAPSGDRDRPRTYADEVADLTTVMNVAGDRPLLLGGSYGATVVLHAAAAGVDTAGVVAFEPPVYAAGPELGPVLDAYRDLVAAGRLGAAARLFALRVARIPGDLLDSLIGPDPDPDIGDPVEAHGCLRDLEAMTSDVSGPRDWGAIAGPLLLLYGDQSWEPMRSSMERLELGPSAERRLLVGQRHFVTAEAPEVFTEAVRPFLRRHARRR